MGRPLKVPQGKEFHDTYLVARASDGRVFYSAVDVKANRRNLMARVHDRRELLVLAAREEVNNLYTARTNMMRQDGWATGLLIASWVALSGEQWLLGFILACASGWNSWGARETAKTVTTCWDNLEGVWSSEQVNAGGTWVSYDKEGNPLFDGEEE